MLKTLIKNVLSSLYSIGATSTPFAQNRTSGAGRGKWDMGAYTRVQTLSGTTSIPVRNTQAWDSPPNCSVGLTRLSSMLHSPLLLSSISWSDRCRLYCAGPQDEEAWKEGIARPLSFSCHLGVLVISLHRCKGGHWSVSLLIWRAFATYDGQTVMKKVNGTSNSTTSHVLPR